MEKAGKTQKLTAEDIDVKAATLHAERLVRVLKDSAYVAPELFQRVLNDATAEMNGIARALRLHGGV